MEVIDVLGNDTDLLSSCFQIVDYLSKRDVSFVGFGFGFQRVEVSEPFPGFLRVLGIKSACK
jgi:hypothetical protein